MSKKKTDDQLSDKEVERRATEALRRAMTTPYKPQSEMVGKVGRKATKKKSHQTKRVTRRNSSPAL